VEQSRTAWVKLIYNGRFITDEVTKSLLSFTYTDNINAGDDLQITMEDVDGNWAGPWYPDVASIRITGEGGEG